MLDGFILGMFYTSVGMKGTAGVKPRRCSPRSIGLSASLSIRHVDEELGSSFVGGCFFVFDLDLS